jgi:hypothetical protein
MGTVASIAWTPSGPGGHGQSANEALPLNIDFDPRFWTLNPNVLS